MSQQDLADAIGTHRNTIADIERGTSEGRPDTKQAIATALGCTIGELYEDPSASLNRASVTLSSEETRNLLRSTMSEVVHGHDLTNVPDDILEALANAPEHELEAVRAVLNIRKPAAVKRRESR